MFLVSLVERSSVSAFPPQNIHQEPSTKSHTTINFYGIYLSTHQFLLRHKFVNGTGKLVSEVLSEFFGKDGDSQTIFYQNILRITEHQNLVQRELANFAHYHVNGEQILTAHNYVRSLRKSLIDLSQSRPDIDILRERIGQCLYTLQQFYSNTNWVELHGDTIIKEFGISATLSVSISDISDEPCSDCPTDLASLQSGLCKNNTRTTKITSGYKSEQDVSKPPSNNPGIGKCSHGSQDDTSRLKSATGGIYKGRSSSAHAPHFHLHNEAFEAAKLATVYFLSDENDGLFSHLGIYLTKEVFQIKSKKENKEVKDYSITFVIDVTGSMSDNIAGVIQGAATFVDQIRQSDRIPEKYILVTFSDPVDLEKIRVTDDADEMISWINGLTVSGGGDCPEYSLSGLIAGATFSNHNSTIYIYTDAPAKDESRETEVIEILQRKNITPKFRLRPECGTRRKRDTDRYKRQSSVYDSIAQATGGDVERFSTSAELADKVREDLMSELSFIQSNSSQAISQNNLPSSISIIKWRSTHTDQLTNIEVDNSVDSLRIEINGTSNSSEIHLRNPNGSLVDSGSRDVTLQYSDYLTIFSIESPSKGLWTQGRGGNVPGHSRRSSESSNSNISNMAAQFSKTHLGSQPNLIVQSQAITLRSPQSKSRERVQRYLSTRHDMDGVRTCTPCRTPLPHEIPNQERRRASDPVRTLDPNFSALKRLQRFHSLNVMKPLPVPQNMKSLLTKTDSNCTFNSSRSSIATDNSVQENDEYENGVELDTEMELLEKMINDNEDMLIPDDMQRFLNEHYYHVDGSLADTEVAASSRASILTQDMNQATPLPGDMDANMQVNGGYYGNHPGHQEMMYNNANGMQQYNNTRPQMCGDVNQNNMQQNMMQTMQHQNMQMMGGNMQMNSMCNQGYSGSQGMQGNVQNLPQGSNMMHMPHPPSYDNGSSMSSNGPVPHPPNVPMPHPPNGPMSNSPNIHLQHRKVSQTSPQNQMYPTMQQNMNPQMMRMNMNQNMNMNQWNSMNSTNQAMPNQQFMNNPLSSPTNMPHPPNMPKVLPQNAMQQMGGMMHQPQPPVNKRESESPQVQVPHISTSHIPPRAKGRNQLVMRQHHQQMYGNQPQPHQQQQVMYNQNQSGNMMPQPPGPQMYPQNSPNMMYRQNMNMEPQMPNGQPTQNQLMPQPAYPTQMEMSPGCNQVTSSTDRKEPQPPPPPQQPPPPIIEEFMENINSISSENLLDNMSSISDMCTPTAMSLRSASQSSLRYNPSIMNSNNMVVNDMSSVLTQLAEENKYLNMRH